MVYRQVPALSAAERAAIEADVRAAARHRSLAIKADSLAIVEALERGFTTRELAVVLKISEPALRRRKNAAA